MTAMINNVCETSPLSEALSQYLRLVTPLKKGKNQEFYRAKPLIAFFQDTPLKELNSLQVAAYRDKRLADPHPKNNKKTLSASTVKLEMMLLSHLFTVAASEWGIEIDNPVTKVRKPKPPPGRSRRLTPRESTLLLRKAHAHPNKELYPVIVIALETAMRQGEIIGLRWEHISWKKRVAHLPYTKNGSMRDVPLSNNAIHVLKHILKPKNEGKVFQYSQSGIKSTWRCLVKSAGIEDLHFHDLRHEAISRLFEKGLDMLEVSTISGHKSLSMLKRYTHLQAYKLVSKLDPKKKRKKADAPQEVRDFMIAYPAIIERRVKKCTIDFYDFVGLRITARNCDAAIAEAKNQLLRKIVMFLHNNEKPPRPTSNLEEIKIGKLDSISMISPL